ncbi:MAG: CotH kinase family protein, partial [Kiritimatiellae bacterium]|nr:CotH kinase family protein [Kiritimatiellia bacterium]
MSRKCIALAIVLFAVPAVVHAATVSTPTFSKARGFYDAAMSVTISSATSGATIRYTTDGSAPTASSGTVLANGGSVTVSTTTCLRAVACQSGLTTSAVQTHTYLFLGQVLSQPLWPAGYPATWSKTHPPHGPWSPVGTDGDYEMDPTIVNKYGATTMKNSLKALPSLVVAMKISDMFGTVYQQEPGQTIVEKAMSMEWLDPADPASNFQIDCGIRSHSWAYAWRCFRLKYKSPFGPTSLNQPVFKKAPMHPTTKTGFDKLILRSGCGDKLWRGRQSTVATRGVEFRDEWLRSAFRDMAGVGAHGTYVHLYINHLYWGVYNLVERPDHSHCALWYGGSNSDWYSGHHAGDISGNDDRFDSMVSYAVSGNYTAVKSRLDINNFCDYILLSWFAGLYDWPQNNHYYANRNNPVDKVFWMQWDGDYTWELSSSQTTGRVHPSFWPTPQLVRPGDPQSPLYKIWHGLRKNSDFINDFSRRVDLHCKGSGTLIESKSKARWDSLASFLSPAMYAECARWGDSHEDAPSPLTPLTHQHWLDAVAVGRASMNNIVNEFIADLKKYGYYKDPAPTIPAAPSGLAASATSMSQISLSWTDNSGDETQFKVER